jgi:hypothetical protein
MATFNVERLSLSPGSLVVTVSSFPARHRFSVGTAEALAKPIGIEPLPARARKVNNQYLRESAG